MTLIMVDVATFVTLTVLDNAHAHVTPTLSSLLEATWIVNARQDSWIPERDVKVFPYLIEWVC